MPNLAGSCNASGDRTPGTHAADLIPRSSNPAPLCTNRGPDTFTDSLFTLQGVDNIVPATHLLRAICVMANAALAKVEDLFVGIYEVAAKGGRPSIDKPIGLCADG